MTNEEQLSVAKCRAERDMARQELVIERHRRKLAESAAAERETVRAEDREAAAWVRDQGGLAHVMGIVNDFRAVVERIGVEWSESELHAIMGVLDSRLMPKGYEWPLYDTGEMVELGCQVVTSNGGGEVCGIEFDACGICVLYTEGVNGEERVIIDLENGECVKRPVVLAADGEPLEVGQTVWNVEYGTEWCVTKAKDGKVFIAFEDFAAEECDPSLLTHQRPVLDADGVPIKEGDTVYGTETGNELVVDAFVEDGSHGPYTVDCHFAVGGEPNYYRPDKLTHTKPESQDSWERIEEDAAMQPYAYCVGNGLFEECDEIETTPTNELFARDLVRRCKALAGASER